MGHYLVTGATGFIGKVLGLALVRNGHQVSILSRNIENAKKQVPFPVTRAFSWDNLSDLGQEVFDGVVHLAGENIADQKWSEAVKEKLFESRVKTTENLVRALHQNPPKVWVQGSAVGIYGATAEGVTADEETPAKDEFLSHLCVAWENSTGLLPQGVRKVILRTGVVLGHQGGAFPKMYAPTFSGLGGALGSGHQKMSVIHVDDVVGFILHSLDHLHVSGPYNLVIESPIEQKDFSALLSEKFNLPKGPGLPAMAVKLAFGEMASLLLGNQAVRSIRMKESGYTMKYPTVDSILESIRVWYQHPFDSNRSTLIHFEEQFVPKPVEGLFPFFSVPQNLEKITPDFLNFKIKRVSTPEIQKNTRIQYQLKLHGIPFGWLTDIHEWSPPYSFVDNQLKGPYALWFHRHDFESIPGGTVMRDHVRYLLPLGNLGSVVGGSKVKADVRKIFQYRRDVISRMA